jgi:hypothetical protein
MLGQGLRTWRQIPHSHTGEAKPAKLRVNINYRRGAELTPIPDITNRIDGECWSRSFFLQTLNEDTAVRDWAYFYRA